VIDPDLVKLALAFREYLNTLPWCKDMCIRGLQSSVPADSRCPEILKRGKLKRLISKCPYLSMSGGSHGGTYLLKLDKDMFATLVSENKIPLEGVDCSGLMRILEC